MSALLLTLVLAQYTPQEAQALFVEGNDAYYKGDYATAKDRYEKLLAAGLGGPDVLFNLGTTHLAAGELGPAVLELERAAMHLAGLSGLATDLAFLQGASTYGRLRTTAINTTMRLCGNRFGRGAIRVGGVGLRSEAALYELLTLLAGGFLWVRSALGGETAESLKKKQARAAKKRLAAAEKLLKVGSTADFYAEVERALASFMSAKLDTPVAGLVRAELVARLTAAGVPEDVRTRIVAVLETCDLGRYAPGMGEAAARRRTLNDAQAAMEGWS